MSKKIGLLILFTTALGLLFVALRFSEYHVAFYALRSNAYHFLYDLEGLTMSFLIITILIWTHKRSTVKRKKTILRLLIAIELIIWINLEFGAIILFWFFDAIALFILIVIVLGLASNLNTKPNIRRTNSYSSYNTYESRTNRFANNNEYIIIDSSVVLQILGHQKNNINPQLLIFLRSNPSNLHITNTVHKVVTNTLLHNSTNADINELEKFNIVQNTGNSCIDIVRKIYDYAVVNYSDSLSQQWIKSKRHRLEKEYGKLDLATLTDRDKSTALEFLREKAESDIRVIAQAAECTVYGKIVLLSFDGDILTFANQIEYETGIIVRHPNKLQ